MIGPPAAAESAPYADGAALVQRAQAGDPHAFREIVLTHQRRVFAQLRGMLRPAGREALVEDLAQETFMRAFAALPRFVNRGGRLGAWLLTIATRLALNELRRRRPVQAVDTVAEVHGCVRGDPSTECRLVSDAVDRAVRALPAPFRAAFLLREIHGFEYAEIAESLEIDVGTVKSRLSRARARLREALAEVQDERT